MVLAILNWILMLFMIVFQAVWIHSVLNHDGKCHTTTRTASIVSTMAGVRFRRRGESVMTENNNQSVVQNDPVNHPSHYTAGGIEVIDFLESWNFPFHLANAIKYICRAGRKDKSKTAEDLRKAIWYINRYIE